MPPGGEARARAAWADRSWSLLDVLLQRRLFGGGASHVDGARQIDLECEADQNSDSRGHRHGDQHADKSEEVSENEQREYQPNRVQPNLGADYAWRQKARVERL